MQYKEYHVVGLQRTGTNWISELVGYNFYVKKTNKGFWKHLTPLGAKPAHANEEYLQWKYDKKDLILEDNILYIATSKEKNIWLRSLRKNPEDFYLTHTNDINEIYEAWHRWREVNENKNNFIYHDYIDWLNNWETYLKNIQEITNWKPKFDKFKNVTWNVSRSPNFDITQYK